MNRGARVYLKDGSPRNVGTIESVIHRAEGSFCTVRWDNGWRTHYAGFADLVLAEPEAPTLNECELMRAKLKGGV